MFPLYFLSTVVEFRLRFREPNVELLQFKANFFPAKILQRFIFHLLDPYIPSMPPWNEHIK
jgi:hypothetical protein